MTVTRYNDSTARLLFDKSASLIAPDKPTVYAGCVFYSSVTGVSIDLLKPGSNGGATNAGTPMFSIPIEHLEQFVAGLRWVVAGTLARLAIEQEHPELRE